MTVDTGRLQQAINSQRSFADTSDHERQEYVSFIFIAARQDEISFKKVLHVNGTWLTKLTVQYRDGKTETKWDGLGPEPDIFSKTTQREEKPHRQWWATGSDYERWRWSRQNLPGYRIAWSNGLYGGIGLTFESWTLPKISTFPFYTRQRRKRQINHTTRQAIDYQKSAVR